MRRVILAVLTLSMALMFAVPAVAHPEPYCGIRWGSGPKTATQHVQGPVTGVRAGQHACYDRLVVDLRGTPPGYDVRYVDQVTQDGSGAVVPLRGGAKLQVTVNAPAYDQNGQATFPANNPELINTSGYKTFRQVAGAGSFEGYTTIGLGVRARLPFRVFRLTGPGSNSRLVIDVAHKW